MCILSKQFSDKFNRLYTKSMNDNKSLFEIKVVIV